MANPGQPLPGLTLTFLQPRLKLMDQLSGLQPQTATFLIVDVQV